MIIIICLTLVVGFLLYCLNQIGALEWLWEAIETLTLLLGAFWPMVICGLMFGLGWQFARHAA